MSKKYSIKEFLEVYNNTDFGNASRLLLLEDHTACKWDIRDERHIVFVDRAGDFYDLHLPEGSREAGEYMVANIDTMFGQWVTGFFLVENRVVGLDEEEEEEDFDDDEEEDFDE